MLNASKQFHIYTYITIYHASVQQCIEHKIEWE